MRTVPLYGKKAAGRVALVDDEDYELVMLYKWYVWEIPPQAGRRTCGPYAIANFVTDTGKRTTIRMHCLIMVTKGVDHQDHDGLNNQRSNLRPATESQNGANQRAQDGRSSSYKGVAWERRRNQWRAVIKVHGRFREVGGYPSELQAAYAYDEAARKAFGAFACPNFDEGPTQAMRDEWHAAQEAHAALMAEVSVKRERTRKAAQKQWWDQREPEMRICAECGGEYRSRSTRSFYCSRACGWQAWSRRRRELEQEGGLF